MNNKEAEQFIASYNKDWLEQLVRKTTAEIRLMPDLSSQELLDCLTELAYKAYKQGDVYGWTDPLDHQLYEEDSE